MMTNSILSRNSSAALIACFAFLQNAQSCDAQNYGYQNNGYKNYSGFGGNVNNNSSFQGGYSGFNNKTQPLPQHRGATNQAPSSKQNIPPSTMASLENTLNKIDTNSAWSNVPVSNAAPVNRQMQQAQQQYYSKTPMQPAQAATPRGALGRMFPGVTPQSMMRIFFEGGSPSPAGSGGFGGGGNVAAPKDNSQASSTAYNNYQRAQNEDQKARNYAERARNDKDKWNKKNWASQAEYAANNAYYAAQAAESAAYNGGSQAQSYANLARDASNRARANADRARYNADTY